MKQASITVRMAPALKHDAEAVMALLGTNPTDLINGLYLYLAERRRLPFRISRVPQSACDAWCEAMRLTAAAADALERAIEATADPAAGGDAITAPLAAFLAAGVARASINASREFMLSAVPPEDAAAAAWQWLSAESFLSSAGQLLTATVPPGPLPELAEVADSLRGCIISLQALQDFPGN